MDGSFWDEVNKHERKTASRRASRVARFTHGIVARETEHFGAFQPAWGTRFYVLEQSEVFGGRVYWASLEIRDFQQRYPTDHKPEESSAAWKHDGDCIALEWSEIM